MYTQSVNSSGSSGFDKTKPTMLYYLSINNGQAFKIGITNKSVKERYSKTDVRKIHVVYSVWYTVGKDAYKEEQRLLKKHKDLLYKGPSLLKKTEIQNYFTQQYFKELT